MNTRISFYTSSLTYVDVFTKFWGMLKEVYQAISGTPGTSPNSKLRIFTPVMHSPYSGECLSVRQSRVVQQGSIESYILANRHSLTNNEATKWLQIDLHANFSFIQNYNHVHIFGYLWFLSSSSVYDKLQVQSAPNY